MTSDLQLDYHGLFRNLSAAAERAGFKVNVFDAGAGIKQLVLSRESGECRPHCYLSSGMHGDEPAGPHDVLKLLEDPYFDERANWHILPLLNPSGLMSGTRENADGMDLNRDYRHGKSKEVSWHLEWLQGLDINFNISLCLH